MRTRFEKSTESLEALAAVLASISTADAPWDVAPTAPWKTAMTAHTRTWTESSGGWGRKSWSRQNSSRT